MRERLGDQDLVLDVGGWAKPFPRADWVLDLMPYETRGLYGEVRPDEERFSAATWVVRDICEPTPWPFEDGQFAFAVCSHTLEDIRDPIRVCSELVRVARAGYIEVPSRLEEQTWGIHGPWVGWSHHRWLVDISDSGLRFVAKPGVLHGSPELQLPRHAALGLGAEERVETLFWTGSFEYHEQIFIDPSELHAYLAEPFGRPRASRAAAPLGSFLRRRLSGARRRIMPRLSRR